MRIVAGSDGSAPSLIAQQLLAETRWPAGSVLHLVPDTETAPGPAALLDAASSIQADLIVVSSRGLDVPGDTGASALADLLEQAPCPVLVARSPRVSHPLVAIDRSRSARAIMRTLRSWRAFAGLPVEVLSVAPAGAAACAFVTPWEPTPFDQDQERELEDRYDLACERASALIGLGWPATPSVRAGEPAREIIEAADDLGCDLIVIGSRGHGWVRGPNVGNVAREVVARARVSVLITTVPGRAARLERAAAGLGLTAVAAGAPRRPAGAP